MNGRAQAFRSEPWEQRIAPRFDPTTPASRALIDLTTTLFRLHLGGIRPSEAEKVQWLQAFRAAAYAGRKRRRAYDARTAGIGESERLRVTAQGALWYAAALIDVQNAHLRD